MDLRTSRGWHGYAACLIGLAAAGACSAAIGQAASAPPRIEPKALCVTNGTILERPDGRLTIESASSRAVVRAATAQAVRIRFRYLGPTLESKPLASGEMRRQIGIKLRAQDTCNLVYAMWHIEPDARIAVAVKRNDGLHTHAECDARGYTNVKPTRGRHPPAVAPGELHELRAALREGALTVWADGQVAWEGALGERPGPIDGPVGLRTDNGRFELEFLADPPVAGQPPSPDPLRYYRCEAGPAD